MRDFRNFFKAEDFGGLSREFWAPEFIDRANQLLREAVQGASKGKDAPHDSKAHGGLAFSQSGIVRGCARCEWLTAESIGGGE